MPVHGTGSRPIFHAIISEAADDFVGITRRHTTRYSMIYRSVSHRHLRSLCDDVVKSRLPSKYTKCAPAGGFGSDIEAVATALSELQEKRHIADYDPLARTTLSDAKLAIAASKAALGRLRTSNKIKRKAFLSLVVFLPG